VVGLNKNRISLGDIVFVNMNNVMDNNFVGKAVRMHEGTKVRVNKADNFGRIVYINRCSHANETQRKQYFKDCLRG